MGDAKSADLPQPEESKPEETLSRRGFLRKAAVKGAQATAMVAAGNTIGAFLGPSGILSPNHPPANEPNPQTSVALAEPLQEPEPPKSELFDYLNNHPLLVNLSAAQRREVEHSVEKQIMYYRREDEGKQFATLGQIKSPGLLKRIKDSGDWQDRVNRIATERKFSLDSFARRTLIGMIFAESEGDESENLFQIDPKTAKELAKKHGIDLGKDNENLSDPETNIALALEYLDKLYDLFPDPTLAVWTYNLGEGTMGIGIYECVMENWGTNPQEREAIENKFESDDPATAYYINILKLNFINILKSKAAVEGIKKNLKKMGEVFEGPHQDYIPRVLAGGYLIRSTPTGQTTV